MQKENKMRVLEVLDTYYPKFDGPTMVITNYCKSLNKINGIQAEACVPKFPKYKDNQPFNVFRVKSLKGPEGYYYGVPGFDGKLKKYLKENKFEIIHLHSPFTMCSFFVKYGKKHNIPTVFTFHTKFHEDFDRMLKLKTTRKLAMKYIMHNINRADYVLTVSDGAAECLKDYGYKKNIDVIRNGTDLLPPENSDSLKATVKEKYGLTNEIIFLSVGRIVENKRIGFALEVMAKLKAKGINFKYLIVGTGNYENELKKMVEQLGLQSNVIFTGKIMDRQLLAGHYLCADLFIFPSTFDTASLAPIEAAAMKLPTIMTLGCPTAEIITDGQNGLLAKELDVEDWAQKIYNCLKAKTLPALKEKAYAEVYKSWDTVAIEVAQYYQNIIEKKDK